ncbi:PhnD/SsuA/transferrin family substrate-binding protein [Ectothiorhodospiraceae bacterium 2226]|nr:PhnD/SsuA/transferrin family substrate-binding protein [Ectothiorhodospiraceae bacterium 2226]
MATRRLILLLLLVLLTPFGVRAEAPREELVLGSVAMDIPAIMHRRLLPLTDYLSETVERPVSLRLSPNMEDAIDALAAGTVDLAYLTPVAYLRARERGAELVVKTVTQGKASFQLMIVVREDSLIREVDDLRGKVFAFGDRGAVLQRAVVVGAGLALEEFADYKFIGHYDNIVRGVIAGDFDAGILKDTMAFDWEARGIRILYASPALPPYNISARPGLDPALVARLRAAFLALDVADPAHVPVVAAMDPEYTGFAPIDDAEYDVVRRLIRPFETASSPDSRAARP